MSRSPARRPDVVARRRRVAAGLWMTVIVVSGVLPTQAAVHAVSDGRDSLVTSVGHFAAYAVLGWLLMAASADRRPMPAALALSFAVAATLGIAIEVVQAPLPYRDCQVSDALVDICGAVVGLGTFSAAARCRWGRRSRCG